MIGLVKDYPAIVPYLTCGWPTEEAFLDAVEGAADAGCPFFEVGFPFSDPIADGPVIERSSAEALRAGVTLDRAFELTKAATDRSKLGAVVMTYANLVFYPGLASFCKRLKQAGGLGLIVPDLSFEESGPVVEACQAEGLQLVSFLAPTSAPRRRQAIAQAAQGFLYVVAVRGVTGGQTAVTTELSTLIKDAKRFAKVPALVGFGMRGPDQVNKVLAQGADGAIVGTALIETVGAAYEAGHEVRYAVRDFLVPLVEATHPFRDRGSTGTLSASLGT